jgi:hypothetical protein
MAGLVSLRVLDLRAEALLLCFAALAALFSMLGCTGGRSQADQESHAPQKKSDNVKLALLAEHDSGVSGTASFQDTSGRLVVKLELRGLPKPNTFYLAHIHPGNCAEGEGHEHGGSHGEEGYGHDHGTSGHEHGAEIKYPLSQVKSDAEGRGSSTTTLRETSVEKLFSGEPNHVNVHEAGSGNPPILACAHLKRVE